MGRRAKRPPRLRQVNLVLAFIVVFLWWYGPIQTTLLPLPSETDTAEIVLYPRGIDDGDAANNGSLADGGIIGEEEAPDVRLDCDLLPEKEQLDIKVRTVSMPRVRRVCARHSLVVCLLPIRCGL